MGPWILISRKMWAESLPLMTASLGKEENTSDFLFSLLYLLSTYYVPSSILVTGGHSGEQKGADQFCPVGASVPLRGGLGLPTAGGCVGIWLQGLVFSCAFAGENGALLGMWAVQIVEGLKAPGVWMSLNKCEGFGGSLSRRG